MPRRRRYGPKDPNSEKPRTPADDSPPLVQPDSPGEGAALIRENNGVTRSSRPRRHASTNRSNAKEQNAARPAGDQGEQTNANRPADPHQESTQKSERERGDSQNNNRRRPNRGRSALGRKEPQQNRAGGEQREGGNAGEKNPRQQKPSNRQGQNRPARDRAGQKPDQRLAQRERRPLPAPEPTEEVNPSGGRYVSFLTEIRPSKNQKKGKGRRSSNERQAGSNRNRTVDWNDRGVPSVPIRTNQGIKARSQRGDFSKNWWARRWIEAMEQLVDPGRLQRGRSYARSGQVLSLQEVPFGVEARVQGSRPQPYDVTIMVTPLTDEQWERVADALSEQAIFTAQLLAGEMPENIEDAFHEAQVSLFPEDAGDLFSNCSCPDWANPCKHVAATHYILGDRFDDDPFLLFRMRGRSQEQIMQALRQQRSAGQDDAPDKVETAAPTVQIEPLDDKLDSFWDPQESLDTFPLTIQPPSVDMPLLKRLGEPPFANGEALQALLKPAYESMMVGALRAAYTEEEPEDTALEE